MTERDVPQHVKDYVEVLDLLSDVLPKFLSIRKRQINRQLTTKGSLISRLYFKFFPVALRPIMAQDARKKMILVGWERAKKPGIIGSYVRVFYDHDENGRLIAKVQYADPADVKED